MNMDNTIVIEGLDGAGTTTQMHLIAKRLEEEFGDLLFAVINAARLYGVKPENALEHTNRKFIDRFNYIEAGAKAQGKKVSDLTLAEMDALWDEYKTKNENR